MMSLVDTEMKTNKTNTPSCDCLPLPEWVSLAIHDGEPVFIMRKKAKQTIEEKRQKMREYVSTPEYKAAKKAYDSSPEVVARRNSPEVKAARKARRDDPLRKAAKNAAAKAYDQRPDIKAKRLTPEYKLAAKIRRNTPEAKAAAKERRATPHAKAMAIAAFARRRALKKAATIGDTKEITKWLISWKSSDSANCHWCKKQFPTSYCHADHVMPLKLGGLHCISNLVIACKSCNLRKNTKHPDVWMKIISA